MNKFRIGDIVCIIRIQKGKKEAFYRRLGIVVDIKIKYDTVKMQEYIAYKIRFAVCEYSQDGIDFSDDKLCNVDHEFSENELE